MATIKRTHVKRPLIFKLDAWRLYIQDNLQAAKAFEIAGKYHNLPLSGCMTHYASGYMNSDIKDLLRRELKRRTPQVVEYFTQHNLSTEF